MDWYVSVFIFTSVLVTYLYLIINPIKKYIFPSCYAVGMVLLHNALCLSFSNPKSAGYVLSIFFCLFHIHLMDTISFTIKIKKKYVYTFFSTYFDFVQPFVKFLSFQCSVNWWDVHIRSSVVQFILGIIFGSIYGWRKLPLLYYLHQILNFVLVDRILQALMW